MACFAWIGIAVVVLFAIWIARIVLFKPPVRKLMDKMELSATHRSALCWIALQQIAVFGRQPPEDVRMAWVMYMSSLDDDAAAAIAAGRYQLGEVMRDFEAFVNQAVYSSLQDAGLLSRNSMETPAVPDEVADQQAADAKRE